MEQDYLGCRNTSAGEIRATCGKYPVNGAGKAWILIREFRRFRNCILMYIR